MMIYPFNIFYILDTLFPAVYIFLFILISVTCGYISLFEKNKTEKEIEKEIEKKRENEKENLFKDLLDQIYYYLRKGFEKKDLQIWSCKEILEDFFYPDIYKITENYKIYFLGIEVTKMNFEGIMVLRKGEINGKIEKLKKESDNKIDILKSKIGEYPIK